MTSLDLDDPNVLCLSCMVTFRLAARWGYRVGWVPGWTQEGLGSGCATGSIGRWVPELLLDSPAHSRVRSTWLSHPPLPASVSLAEHKSVTISTSSVALGVT